MNKFDAMKLELQQFVGLKAWRPVAGAGTGTHVSIGFGDGIRRPVPLRNPTLDDKNRNYESEHSVFIENARWALYRSQDLLCSTDSDQHVFVERLKVLEGRAVERIDVDPANFSCSISFAEGFCLDIFGLPFDEEVFDDLYSVFTPRTSFVVPANREIDQVDDAD